MGDVNIPGIRFVPTDEEVVMEYLVKAAMEEPLPGNFVIQRDLYADKAPWEILNNHEGGGDVLHHLPWQTIKSREENSGRIKKDSTIYVLTALKKAGRCGNRIGRRAGCGGWHGENGNKIVEVEGGRVIGYKRMFIFEVQDETVARDIEMGLMIQHHWIMHEYTLDYDDGTSGFAICKLMVDESKKVKIAPKSRMRKKTAGVRGGSGHVHEAAAMHVVMSSRNIQAVTEEEEVAVFEKIHDHECHSRRNKRMRCVNTQADEGGNNNNPQRRKTMPPLELAEDHPITFIHDQQQQPTTITDDDGNGLVLVQLQEEPTTNFGVDDDFEVDQYLNPIMWPTSESDQFTLQLEEEEKGLQEGPVLIGSCTVVPNSDSSAAAAIVQQPTSTSSTSSPRMDDDHLNSISEAAAVVVQGKPECSTTIINTCTELPNGSLDLDEEEEEAAVPTPRSNYVDDDAGQYTWVRLPQLLPPVLEEEKFLEIDIGDLWSF